MSLRDDQRAEALVEPARGQRGALTTLAPPARAVSCASPPRMPFGRNITTATSSRPIQKYQYCGVDAGELVARHHEDDGADEPAVEPAGAAEHQDHQHVGRALEARARRARRSRWSAPAARRRCRRSRRRSCRSCGCARGSARRSPACARVLADAAQRQAERRIDQPPRDQEHEEQHDQRIGVGGVAVEIEAEDAEDRPHAARPAARRRRR